MAAWQGSRCSAGLGRQYRLTRPAQFRRVFSSRHRSRDKYFTVVVQANDRAYARLGLVISKKSLRLAVLRNTMKRLIRESFRSHQDLLNGLDVVVVSHKNIVTINNHKIRRALLQHWKKIRRCKN